ncbi:hypothetical protein ACE6H2_022015 [Prunus campanulata]
MEESQKQGKEAVPDPEHLWFFHSLEIFNFWFIRGLSRRLGGSGPFFFPDFKENLPHAAFPSPSTDHHHQAATRSATCDPLSL